LTGYGLINHRTLYLSAFNNQHSKELRTGNTTTEALLVGIRKHNTHGLFSWLVWIAGRILTALAYRNPAWGLIPAGGNQIVDIYADATGPTSGTYNHDLIISAMIRITQVDSSSNT
jgi:hypothetical protein